MKLKIIDRYLLKSYIPIFIIISFSFVIFFLLGDLFDLSKRISENNVDIKYLLRYFYYISPYYFFRFILPLSNLITVFLFVGLLSKNSEIIAMLSCGISIKRIILPIFIFSICLTMVSLILGLNVLPIFFSKASNIKSYDIKKHRKYVNVFQNIFLKLSNKYLIEIGDFNIETSNYSDIVITQLNKFQKVIFRIDAQKMIYKNNKWSCVKCKIRYWEKNRNNENDDIKKFINIDKYDIDIKETPKQIYQMLTFKNKKIDELTFSQLKKYYVLMKQSGLRYKFIKVYLYHKFAFPFSILILMIVAFPIALFSNKQNLAAGFGISLIIAFLYNVINYVFITLGHLEFLPPLLSVWIGKIIFVIFSFIIYFKLRRQ